MVMPAKIQLSPAEQRLLTNAELLLTKNRVLKKIWTLLEEVQEQMQQCASTFSNPHTFQTPPKISRGENYLGLPYLILDYPRSFDHENVFAIRSFFWWGNFFSSTLQVSGKYKNEFIPKIEHAFTSFSKHHIGINADPWQHHFESKNYQPIAELTHADFKKLLHSQTHIKLATKLPVAAWQDAGTFLLDNWKLYLDVLL
jgi:hypothetical protein